MMVSCAHNVFGLRYYNNMTGLPFPPPPEFGWYDDDSTVLSDQTGSPNASVEEAQRVGPTAIAPTLDGLAAQAAGRQEESAEGPKENMDDDIEDWDGTVLSSAFMQQAPQKKYRLHNDATGQDILLDKSALLGRKVSSTVPKGAMSIKLDDPTRTISRNHAAVSFDEDGSLWIEDYDSLNGTFVIADDQEEQVKGSPMRLTVPATLRIGDQFFQLTEA
jgi:hypothetical protein